VIWHFSCAYRQSQAAEHNQPSNYHPRFANDRR
jgi:hypothetical protein